MSVRQPGFGGHLIPAAIVHGLLIGAILSVTLLKGCSDTPANLTMPMELIVEAPPDAAEEPPEPVKEAVKPPEPEPDKDDIPEPVKPPEPRKTPPRKEAPRKVEKQKVEVSKVLVKRNRTPPGKPKLTAAEVQRLLDRGARIGKKSTLSDADLRRLLNSDTRFGNGNPATQEMVYLDIIKQTLYRAWDQPTSLGIAGLVTRVEFTFSPDGAITGCRLTAPSGNATMDESVMRAARAVRRINGVPADFFISHRRIPVLFELTGNP